MTNSNYHRGRRLEYIVWKIFEDAGWEIVRAASSKGSIAVTQPCPHCKKPVPFKPDVIASKINPKNKDKAFVVLAQLKREGKK